MDEVTFAFGDRPQIDDLDASDLAGSLRERGNYTSVSAAAKIEAKLRRAPEARSAVKFTLVQLEQLISVLTEALPPNRPELAHLLEEARGALLRGEWAPEE